MGWFVEDKLGPLPPEVVAKTPFDEARERAGLPPKAQAAPTKGASKGAPEPDKKKKGWF